MTRPLDGLGLRRAFPPWSREVNGRWQRESAPSNWPPCWSPTAQAAVVHRRRTSRSALPGFRPRCSTRCRPRAGPAAQAGHSLALDIERRREILPRPAPPLRRYSRQSQPLQGPERRFPASARSVSAGTDVVSASPATPLDPLQDLGATSDIPGLSGGTPCAHHFGRPVDWIRVACGLTTTHRRQRACRQVPGRCPATLAESSASTCW